MNLNEKRGNLFWTHWFRTANGIILVILSVGCLIAGYTISGGIIGLLAAIAAIFLIFCGFSFSMMISEISLNTGTLVNNGIVQNASKENNVPTVQNVPVMNTSVPQTVSQNIGNVNTVQNVDTSEDWTCSNCGKQNTSVAKFCNACGNPKPF